MWDIGPVGNSDHRPERQILPGRQGASNPWATSDGGHRRSRQSTLRRYRGSIRLPAMSAMGVSPPGRSKSVAPPAQLGFLSA
jgi:hypothetical protein